MSEHVRAFYDADPMREWSRKDAPFSEIEFASGLRLIERYFPPTGHVCDIGGGPGRYSIELLKRGYQVTLLDLSEELLRVARTQMAEAGLVAERVLHGDARDLGRLETASADATLVMGPLYHIVEGDERARALRELHRVVKPGGIAIVTFLNAWGLLRTGLTDFPRWYRDPSSLRAMLGVRTFRGGTLANFTEAHWSTPETAVDEATASGFELVSYAGAQGFVGGMRPIVEQLAATEPEAYRNVVQMAAETSELPQYRDASEHLHLVVRKP